MSRRSLDVARGFFSAFRKVKLDPLPDDSTYGRGVPGQTAQFDCDAEECNILLSLARSPGPSRRYHKVLLDIDDVKCRLVPSSSRQSWHFYADVACKEEDYFAFLDAAAKIGLADKRWVEHTKRQGDARLRVHPKGD